MPKSRKANRIIAIDPSSRYVGIAVLENSTASHNIPELIYWGVKTLKNRDSAKLHIQEARNMISELIDIYQPNAIVQEKVWFAPSRLSARLMQIFKETKKQVKKEKISYTEYAPTTVRKHICKNGWATKKETAKIITSIYPELKINLTQDRVWKEKYWGHMFDAVALGLCCLNDSRDKVKIKKAI